jgi:hypothetical protein
VIAGSRREPRRVRRRRPSARPRVSGDASPLPLTTSPRRAPQPPSRLPSSRGRAAATDEVSAHLFTCPRSPGSPQAEDEPLPMCPYPQLV